MSDNAAILCPQCQIGHLHAETLTYVSVHDGMVISVPEMPALTCDVCGYQEFERHALIQVEALVGQGKRLPSSGRGTAKTPPSDTNTTQSVKP